MSRAPSRNWLGPIAGLALLLSLAPAAPAQCWGSWYMFTLSTHPSGRAGAAMVYDYANTRSILFGGYAGAAGPSGETWIWKNYIWTRLNPLNNPLPRREHAMCFDTQRRRTVLFGGYSSSTFLGDTWEFDGSNWALINSNSAPDPRRYAALAFDQQRARSVLFGGFRGAQGADEYFNDTWERGADSWILRAPAASPPARYLHAMVYDTARKRTVLFGGADRDVVFGDTWEYDGVTWKRIDIPGPPPRAYHSMVYDRYRGVAVLHGGVDYAGNRFEDTWEYDGVRWRLMATTGPGKRFFSAAAFDESRTQTVLFGGFSDAGYASDTWIWTGPLGTVPVSFEAQPVDRVVRAGFTARFEVLVSGSGPVSYQWFKDGAPLSDDGRIGGTHDDALVITDVSGSDVGAYRVRATNDCGDSVSAAARLRLGCPADFNADGYIDDFDYFDYLNAYHAPGTSADLNGDGEVNEVDFALFAAMFFSACG
ncbi:MAG: hypothetical protein JNM07_13390 [Phycisphaerae bacterium]|nr:hypothetical protein [Phycisphaerae bacterium]